MKKPHFCRHDYMVFGRIALAIIYTWFGFLKVIHVSPAEPLVNELLHVTMPFFDQAIFSVLFGLFEVALGVMFLFPKLSRITLWIFLAHMVMTFLPLFLLPQATWQGPFVYTLVGQYIVKNLSLIALALIVLQERLFLPPKWMFWR